MSNIRQRADQLISELEAVGINANSHTTSDQLVVYQLISNTMQMIQISDNEFNTFFSIHECNCTKRKAWLNSILYWYKNKKTQG